MKTDGSLQSWTLCSGGGREVINRYRRLMQSEVGTEIKQDLHREIQIKLNDDLHIPDYRTGRLANKLQTWSPRQPSVHSRLLWAACWQVFLGPPVQNVLEQPFPPGCSRTFSFCTGWWAGAASSMILWEGKPSGSWVCRPQGQPSFIHMCFKASGRYQAETRFWRNFRKPGNPCPWPPGARILVEEPANHK